MYLKHLVLRNFRNYHEAEISFSPKLNAICGDNGQGKTSLLEAIFLISTGRSFRTEHLNELICEGSPFFYLEAEIVKDNVTQTVKMSFDGQNRRLQLNANDFSTFQPLLGLLPSVLSAPNDIDLIVGAPTKRRRFLNLHLAQSDPLYVHYFTRYWRAMKQRNCLLRSKSLDAIECWETEMASAAAYLSRLRQGLIEEIREPLAIQSRRLSSEAETVELRLHSSYSGETEIYFQQLQKQRHREKEFGFTLNGPHRDDLSFWLGSRLARDFASEGQKKTAVTALRLAEWERLSLKVGEMPLMAIDDFGWPLDAGRQMLFKKSLQSMGQVFLTTPGAF